jgi:predicted HTH domain antitoxin
MTKDELIDRWLHELWEDASINELLRSVISFHKDSEFADMSLEQVIDHINDEDPDWFEGEEIDPSTITA